MDDILGELTCPITLSLLEDPISVPCCGKAFGRAALVAVFKRATRCPLCNGDLSEFDAKGAAGNVVLSAIIVAAPQQQRETSKARELKKAKAKIAALQRENNDLATSLGESQAGLSILYTTAQQQLSSEARRIDETNRVCERINDLTTSLQWSVSSAIVRNATRATRQAIAKIAKELWEIDRVCGIIYDLTASLKYSEDMCPCCNAAHAKIHALAASPTPAKPLWIQLCLGFVYFACISLFVFASHYVSFWGLEIVV